MKAGLSHLKWARMTSTIWATEEDAVGEKRGPIAVGWTERDTWDQWGALGPQYSVALVLRRGKRPLGHLIL